MSQETFKLEFLDGPRKGETIPLADNLITLGRATDNTIVVDDPSISRSHLNFYVEDHTVSVEDRGSTKGTRLNDHALEGRQVISHGDQLQVGDHHIRVISLSETLSGVIREDIFGHPDEIEEKFNSESDLKVRHVVIPPKEAPQAAPESHLDSQDEITGVFDFSELQKEDASKKLAAHAPSHVNRNDGTVPLYLEEKKSPLLIIVLLSTVIVLLAAGLVYILFVNDQGGETPPPATEPEFLPPPQP